MKHCPAPRPGEGQDVAGERRRHEGREQTNSTNEAVPSTIRVTRRVRAVRDYPRIGKAAAGILLSLLPAGGCHHAEPGAPAPAEEAPLPLYVRLQVQVIGLRETAIPADEPFPAPGFRFKEDRVLPVREPDTVAGVELTAEQFQRWIAALPTSGVPTVYVQQAFITGLNFPAGAANSEEKRYRSNWRIDAEAATPRFASITPGFRAALTPFVLSGSQDLLVSADVRIILCDLEPFNASEGFAPPEESARSTDAPPPRPIPLMVQLARQTVLRLTTTARVRPGRAMILAHYVKQYMAPAPIPARGAEPASTVAAEPGGDASRSAQAERDEKEQGGPASKPPESMQPVREHVFYIVTAERTREEPKSDLAIVEEAAPRYALNLTWDQWEPVAPSPSGAQARAPSGQPATAKGDLAEILKAGAAMSNSPQAISEMFSVAATAKKPLQVEAGEDRSYVAGIHRDSDEATSPRTFVIQQVDAGMRLETQLVPAAGGVEAVLQGRFATPARWEERIVIVPSARRKPKSLPAKGAKPVVVAGGTEKYHLQTASQQSAEIQSPMELHPGEILILPLTWRASGDAPPEKQERIAAVSLTCLPDADQKKESVPGAAPTPEGTVKDAPARP